MFYAATAVPDIQAMLALPKTFTEWPTWEMRGTGSSAEWGFVSGLAHDGIGIDGVRIRGVAIADVMDRELTVQLEALVSGRWLHVARADYRPLHAHMNPFDRKDLVRTIPAGSSHFHHFVDNSREGLLDGLRPNGNLPAARAIEPPPSSVRRFFAIVGSELGVLDFDSVQPPDWQGGFAL